MRSAASRCRGKPMKGRIRCCADAVAVQEGGAFSVVLEGVPAVLGARVTREIDIPTIGIGAGPDCGRPGARHPRHASPVQRFHAEIRARVCRCRADDHGGDRAILPGGARGRVSRGKSIVSDFSRRVDAMLSSEGGLPKGECRPLFYFSPAQVSLMRFAGAPESFRVRRVRTVGKTRFLNTQGRIETSLP